MANSTAGTAVSDEKHPHFVDGKWGLTKPTFGVE